MLRDAWRGFMAFGAFLSAGCGVAVPTPPVTQHAADDFREVPYPPPAALAETVPSAPDDKAVWVDGEWAFHGRVYVWRRGGWVIMPIGARHAPWRFFYSRDARLLLAPGTWYDERGRRIEAPEPVVPAETPANEFTPEPATAL